MTPLRRPARRGQSLVEFALVLPLLVVILFGTIEVSRMTNLYLSLQEVARRSATAGSTPDPTLSRRPEAVALDAFKILKSSVPVRFTIYEAWEDQPAGDNITIDVNHEIDGLYYTKVSMTLTMNFMLLPSWKNKNGGLFSMGSESCILNETQGKRRDATTVFSSQRFQLIDLAKTYKQKREIR